VTCDPHVSRKWQRARGGTALLCLAWLLTCAAPPVRSADLADVEMIAVQSIDRAKAGDWEGLQKCYTDQAWKHIRQGLFDEKDRDKITRLKEIALTIGTAKAQHATVVANDRATVELVLTHERFDELVTLHLSKTVQGWRISDGDAPPFFLDNWAHVFQIWDEAYRRSREEADPKDQYRRIIRGIDYSRQVLNDRPSDLSILFLTGQLYRERLADDPNKAFFDPVVRSDTAGTGPRNELNSASQLPVMLDDHGFVLRPYLEPHRDRVRPKQGADGGGYDGAELQYLRPYNTREMGGFPYGLPAQALAYNYYKRAQMLADAVGAEEPVPSTFVVENRPVLALESWAEAELRRGRVAELRLFGHKPPQTWSVDPSVTADDRPESMASGASAKVDLREAEFCYRRAAQTFLDAAREFGRLFALPNDGQKMRLLYANHELSVQGLQATAEADRGYLMLAGASREERPQLVAAPSIAYARSIDLHSLRILKEYVDDEVAAAVFPRQPSEERFNRKNIDQLDPKRYREVLAAVQDHLKADNRRLKSVTEDCSDELQTIQRAERRLKQLEHLSR